MIDGAALKAARITKSEFEPVKVLGNGELTKKFTVKVDKVSASAQAKIEAAGGNGRAAVLNGLKNAFRIKELREKILFNHSYARRVPHWCARSCARHSLPGDAGPFLDR